MRKQLKHILVTCLLGLSCFTAENVAWGANLGFSSEAGTLYNNAVHAYRTRRFTLAKKYFKELIDNYPDDGYTQISRSNLAQLYIANHEYENALSLYREMLDRCSDNQDETSRIRLELCDLLYTLHRYREGIEILEAWQKQEPNNIKCLRKLAAFYLSTGSKDEAWLLLERLMENSNKEAFKDLLDLAVRSGEVDKLINTLESRRAKYKSVVFADFISDCYLALGQNEKAIESLKEINEYQKQTSILKKLANIQISSKKIDDAVETLETLCKYLPSDNQSLKNLGHCYFLQGKKDLAISTWRRQLQRRNQYNQHNQQAYMDYTSVLIEHQLLEEALQGFDEAREKLYINNLFAEEKAAVLLALNRYSEAMEEYLNVLMQGTYKTEIFDKLFDADGKDFNLEKRLIEIKSEDYNTAIIQSLLELYFRKNRMADINKIASLADGQNTIFFDDLFYNRLRQEALLFPEQFHYELAKKIIDIRSDSALELKLAALILKMPEYNEKWLKESYAIAKRIAEAKVIADTDLKYDLCLRVAEFSLYTMNNPEEADNLLGIILGRSQLQSSIKQQIEAKLLRAKIYIYAENFDDAEKTLEEASNLVKNAEYSSNISSVEIEEFVLQCLIEKALLKCHKGEFQEALDSLKSVIDDHKEGNWVNDALLLANDITRLSLGADFNVLKHKLASERALHNGKNDTAISELKEAVKAVPASSSLILDELGADILLASDKNSYDESLLKRIEEFIKEHKNCFKNSDLYELKIKLMQRGNKSKDLIDEEMRSFISKYPNDLRSGKYKQGLENGGKK